MYICELYRTRRRSNSFFFRVANFHRYPKLYQSGFCMRCTAQVKPSSSLLFYTMIHHKDLVKLGIMPVSLKQLPDRMLRWVHSFGTIPEKKYLLPTELEVRTLRYRTNFPVDLCAPKRGSVTHYSTDRENEVSKTFTEVNRAHGKGN